MVLKITAILLTFSLLACKSESPEVHINNAKVNIENKDYSTAIVELRNAIKKDDDNPEPKVMLGQIFLYQGKFSSAKKEFLSAISHGSLNVNSELYLARAFLGLNDLEGIEKLVSYTDTTSLNVKSELLSIYAIALIKEKKINQAIAVIGNADKLGYSGVYYNIAHAKLEVINGSIDGSLDLLRIALKVEPDNNDTLLMMAHLLTVQGENEKAENIYKTILLSSPKNANYKIFYSQSLIRNEKYIIALPYVDEILKLSPSNATANDLKSSIEYSQSNFKNALRHANIAIAEGSRNIGTFVIAGICAYLQKDYEYAHSTFSSISSHLSADPFLQQLYIASQFKTGNVNDAIINIKNMDISDKVYNDFATEMSMAFSSIGRNDDALAIAAMAEQDSTELGKLRIGLLRIKNKKNQGIKQLTDILKVKPDHIDANIGIAYYHLARGDINKGEEVINEWLKSNNNDTSATLLKGYIALKKGEYGAAESMFKHTLVLDNENIKAKLSLIQLSALQGNSEQAFNETLILAKRYPSNFTVAMFLYRFASQTNNIDAIISLYKERLNTQNNNTAVRLLLSRIYASIQQPDKGIEVLEALPLTQHTADVWSIKTLLYFQSQDYRKAFNASEKWLTLDRTNPEPYFRVIQISELTKDYEKGIEYALNAEEIFVNHSAFPLMRATLLQLNQQPVQSQSILENLPEDMKKTSYFLQLKSKVLHDLKLYDESSALAQKRYANYPSSITAKDLALAYVANQRYSHAVDMLNERISKNPRSEVALHLLLAQLQSHFEPNMAIDTYHSILDIHPDNVIALNNISWLLFNINDNQQACNFALRAYSHAPDSPEIQDTYGYCLLKSGKHEASISPLKMAYDSRRNNAEISLHYAESLIINNHLNKARNVLNKIDTNNDAHNNMKEELYDQISSR